MSSPEGPRTVPHLPTEYPAEDMLRRAVAFRELMAHRRSVRHFSDRPVPRELMEELIATASTAPSGAHKQPWTFCLVGDPELKRRIREAAEEEEHASYHGRMSVEWLADLAPLGTDWHKPFLEAAPWLVVVFKQAHGQNPDGTRRKHYYVEESVGLACGLLLAAAQHAGLVTLTHTPSPMNFLTRLLDRPANERPYLLIPMGFAAPDCRVPDLMRKPLVEVLVPYLSVR
ncbi:MAG: nitroreductase family protein [Flavobacteriales bacterium]|nr:nitroreductase family protein [Flavobacteriales bacterium]MBK7943083.1 nitroreductase family protein [Flavobacteriales bacterium]